MSEEQIPLLEGAAATTLSGVGRAITTNLFWRRTSDGLALVICGTAFVSSLYLLTSSTSGSVCRPPTPNGFEVLLTIVPVLVMSVALLLSDGIRAPMGGPPSRLLSLVQHILAAVMAGWITLCMCSLPGWVPAMVSLLLLAGAATVWYYRRREEEDA